MYKLGYNSSERFRDALSAQQEREIRAMYLRAADEAERKSRELEDRTNFSSIQERSRLDELARQLKSAADDIARKQQTDIPKVMQQAANAVASVTTDWARDAGFKIVGNMSSVSQDVVSAVVSGKLYGPMANGQNWSLANSIWGDNAKTHRDIDMIIAEGIASNRSSYDIAKALEQYVDPSARKPWDWSKVYPGSKKVIDYNAQRLARTMVSHAYQAAFVANTKPNPFVTEYIWHISASDRVCDICQDLDGQHFAKDALPLDHPNGMCYWEAVIPDLSEVADRIAEWYNGNNDQPVNDFADFLNGGSSWRTQGAVNDLRRQGDVK